MQTSLNLSTTKNFKHVIDETFIYRNLVNDLKQIPSPQEELLPGIKWGYHNKLFTPAYWKVQYLMYHSDNSFDINYRLGENIIEEIIACLLGGFGLKSEIGLAAFYRLKNEDLINSKTSFSKIHTALREPLIISGKSVFYRFPNQKAKYIHLLLNRTDLDSIPINSDSELREWLMSVKGIGPKTASWITRNFLNSENVAIIDVHIYRAGQILGIFRTHYDLQKDYFILEKKYLQFCYALQVQPSKMDALMWLQMKESSSLLRN